MISITSNTEVTYKEVIDFVLEKIYNSIINYESLDQVVVENQSGKFLIENDKDDIPIYNQQTNLCYKAVDKNRIKQQFQDFLTERGLASRSDEPVSLKGIMNLFNNIANFLTVRLKIVGSHTSNELRILLIKRYHEIREGIDYVEGDVNQNRQIFYDDTEGIEYITTTDIPEDNTNAIDSFTKEQITTSLEDIIKNYTNNQKIYSIDSVISHTCCSSSSSSSSSCSSSSSSSSAFIGYMLL